MVIIIHETYGVNEKKGLQGFQFNYPYDGCVFDKTEQRYFEFQRGLTDKKLMHKFRTEYMFFPGSIKNLEWHSIDRFIGKGY